MNDIAKIKCKSILETVVLNTEYALNNLAQNRLTLEQGLADLKEQEQEAEQILKEAQSVLWSLEQENGTPH